MAIADTITSMQTHTSNAYTMIGYGTDLTGINKNLENLSSTIFEAFLEALRTPDTLFTNLPKKSGTGANITLNDTANAPMRIMLNATDITQDGTPTPSSPQDIHTISGSNKVVVNGSNLFDEEYYKNATYTTNVYTYTKVNIKSGRKLYFKAQLKEGKTPIPNFYLCLCSKTNPNIVGNITAWAIYGSIVPDSSISQRNYATFNDGDELYFSFYPSNTSIQTIFDTYNFWISTELTTYEPYISQEADIDLSSKNLFNPYKVKAENNATLIITPTGFNITRTHGSGFGDEFIASYTIENLKANTIYTFNFDVETELNIGNGSIYVYSDNLFGTALTKSNYASSGNNHKWNITTSSNGKMVIGIYGTTSAQNKIIKLTNVQLEEGSTKTYYMEYYNYGDYCKIGNYEDKFIRTSGKNLINVSLYNANNYLSQKVSLKAGDYITKYIGDVSSAIYVRKADGTTPINGTEVASGFNRTQLAFTLSEDGEYYIQFYKSGTGYTLFSEARLNKGTTALEYEPYGTNEWYIKKNILNKIFNGTEEYTIYNSNSSRITFQCNMSEPLVYYAGGTALPQIISSHFIQENQSATWVPGNITKRNGVNAIYFVMNPDYTIETFKTWLTSNNVKVYTQLATPTYTQITGTLAEQLENVYKNMLSQKGTTNIS